MPAKKAAPKPMKVVKPKRTTPISNTMKAKKKKRTATRVATIPITQLLMQRNQTTQVAMKETKKPMKAKKTPVSVAKTPITELLKQQFANHVYESWNFYYTRRQRWKKRAKR